MNGILEGIRKEMAFASLEVLSQNLLTGIIKTAVK
jgi:hypothetical protein